jgi:hypothetical protein
MRPRRVARAGTAAAERTQSGAWIEGAREPIRSRTEPHLAAAREYAQGPDHTDHECGGTGQSRPEKRRGAEDVCEASQCSPVRKDVRGAVQVRVQVRVVAQL